MAQTDTEAERWFVMLALEYLVAGRAAAARQSFIIPGNLLHHAIEMLLKDLLVGDIGLDGVKKHLHNLRSLWSAAVAKHPALRSSAREAAVAQLDRFESLRYPNDLVQNGAAIRFGWTASEPLPTVRVPVYELVMEEIDELFKATFVATGKDPAFFLALLSEDARVILRDRNRHPIG